MKVRFLQTFFSFLLLAGLSSTAFAQPANDDCANAVSFTLADDEASLVEAAGSTVGGTGSTEPASVCSGSWFGDDIWFSFTTGADFKSETIVVRSKFGTMGGDVLSVGMAVYPSCDAAAIPFGCFSSADPADTELILYTTNLELNTTYYVRVWSGGSPSDNSGTLRVCAFYGSEAPDIILWEEQFDGGLGNWINNPIAPDTANWIWSDQPSNGAFGNYTITSPSSSNGAALFDSDGIVTGGDPANAPAGPPYPNYEGELISPIIDCTNFPPVSLKFWQFCRPLNGTTSFSWSIDAGNTWSDLIEVNGDVEANAQTPSPSFKRYFLPALAGQDSVRIKFVYDSDFYAWWIDDVRLVETERNNLRVMPNFYAIAPNVQTPASQVEPFSFLADVANVGSAPQDNVNLNITITEATGTVADFSADLSYGTIGADSLAENVPFTEFYTPQKDLVTTYTATYTITSDSTDFDPTDNVTSFTFSTTDSTYAKDTGASRNLRPADGLWADGAPHSWTIGNYYYLKEATNANGQPLFGTSARIGITNPQDHAGKDIIIWLYEWTDENNDEIAQKDLASGELVTVGFNTYTITGNETAPLDLTIPIIDFNADPLDPNPGRAPLTADKGYLLMMQYTTSADDDNLFIEATEEHDYSAQFFRSQQAGTPRYSHALGIGNEDFFRMIPTAALETTNFGHTITPLVALNIYPDSPDVISLLPEANLTNIYPVPANQVINIEIDLVNSSENVAYKMFDMNGRLVDVQNFNNVQSQTVRFDVNNYPAGSYLIQINTDAGSRTRRVVVQH